MRTSRTITIVRQTHSIELITTLINQWKPKLALFMDGMLIFALRGNRLQISTRSITPAEWSIRISFTAKASISPEVWREGFDEFVRLFQIDLEKPVTFVDEPEEIEDDAAESEEDESDEEP